MNMIVYKTYEILCIILCLLYNIQPNYVHVWFKHKLNFDLSKLPVEKMSSAKNLIAKGFYDRICNQWQKQISFFHCKLQRVNTVATARLQTRLWSVTDNDIIFLRLLLWSQAGHFFKLFQIRQKSISIAKDHFSTRDWTSNTFEFVQVV